MDDEKNSININGDVNASNVNFGVQNYFGPVNMYPPADASSLPDDPDSALEIITQVFGSVTSRLANIRSTFASTGICIERGEIRKILNWINLPISVQEKAEQKLALVTGKPGQGKSVVMQQLAEAVRGDQYAVLGIKADDLASTHQPLLSLDDLQTLLQMPAPIEQMVRRASQIRPCIVLIDQLDTLALTLNTDEQSLRVVVTLIDRLREIPNVKIVVSCRDFERQNDPVLGGIRIDQTFPVGELQESDINQVLQQINQPQIQELPKALQTLLKTPLYLDIYVQLVLSGESANLEEIATLQDLYGRLWTLRIEHHDQNAPSASERRQAVFHMVDLMQVQRKLKLHVSALDNYPQVRQYLQRTGFVQEEGHTLSFLHQTLFSYCYARKFVSEQRSLSSDVFASPQGFFERQLIIEVIQHLRATDLQTYLSEITTLLFPPEDTRIRYHLRLLLQSGLHGKLHQRTRNTH